MAISWEIVAYDLAEAREELDRLETCLRSGQAPDEEEFQVAMQHIFQHLNFAWNARHETVERYANLTQEDYERLGRFPHDLAFD